MASSNRHISLPALASHEVTSFLEESHLNREEARLLLSRLIAALVDFRIEDVPFFPVIYLTTSLEGLRSLLGVHEWIHLGSTSSALEAADNLLLKSAPLATDRWRIYAHLHGGHIDYGIFAALALPVGHEPRHVLVNRRQQEHDIIKLARISNRCIELESNRAVTRRFFFSTEEGIAYSPYERINRLAEQIALHCDEAIRPSVREYLFSSIKHGTQGAHGALIAVVDHDIDHLPHCFNDAIPFNPPVDIAEKVARYSQREDRIDFRAVAALSDLLTGALQSDGITLFRNDGKLIAYRAFCSLNGSVGGIHGGARKRAYEALKQGLTMESGLTCAFIHSQDGWMDVSMRDA